MMIGQRIKYYRLKKRMNKSELSRALGIKEAEIRALETGKKQPDLKIIRALMSVFGVKLRDIADVPYAHQEYRHLEYRKNCRLSKAGQEYIRLSAEDYFDRFYSLLRILGGNVLKEAPAIKLLKSEGNIDSAAFELRKLLGFPKNGSVPNIIDVLENNGILICLLPYEDRTNSFSGMNGMVNRRPYIVMNSLMTAERQRSTLVHELVHIFFEDVISDDRGSEKYAEAVSGAFLFPREDAKNELGESRTKISADMLMVAKEYGISIQLLAKRVQELGIITDKAYQCFNIRINQSGWRKNEPSQIPNETPHLFELLALRAVSEGKINAQKSSELLGIPYIEMQKKLQVEWNI